MRFIQVSDVNLCCADPENRLSVRPSEDHARDFEKILKRCREEEIDLLFITGNLFAVAPGEEDLRAMDECFSALEKTRVFWVTGRKEEGNPAEGENLLATYEWKSPVTVFTGNSVRRVSLPKLNAEVLGVGYSKKTWEKVDLNALTRGKKAAVQFLLLPEFKPSMTAHPFDYAGIGGAERTGGETVKGLYAPGALEPAVFGKPVKHGYFVGQITVTGRKVSEPFIKFAEGASREYVLLTEEVTPEATLADVKSTLEGKITELGKENLYKIRIIGNASYSLSFGTAELENLPGVLEVSNETDREASLTRLKEARGDDAVGRFLTDILEREPSEGRDKAVEYGLDALFQTEKEV